MYDDGDSLLFVLSARRETGWIAFKKAFDELYAKRLRRLGSANGEPPRFQRIRAARLLAALGHCDISSKGDSIRLVTAPAALASLPLPGLPQAVLCGARSPETAVATRMACDALGRAIRLETRSQDSTVEFAPSRIWVEAESRSVLNRLAESLGILQTPIPSAWTIGTMSGSLDDYLASLEWSADREVNWECEDFKPQLLTFDTPSVQRDEVRLTRYEDPVRLRWVYRLWRGGRSTEVDPLWGRYAILQAVDTRVLLYDPKTCVGAVPRGAPLPTLLSRALTLCSGFAPRFVSRAAIRVKSPERFGFELYTSLPPDVFAVVASKLGHAQAKEPLVLEGSGA